MMSYTKRIPTVFTVLAVAAITMGTGFIASASLEAIGPVVPARSVGQDPNEKESREKQEKDASSAEQAAVPRARKLFASEDRYQARLRETEELVRSMIRDYDEEQQAVRKAAREAKTDADRAALRRRRGADPAFVAGGLLNQAEMLPGTPPAEEALVWIVTHVVYGSTAERAKELIVRDHIRSSKLEPVFNHIQTLMYGSTATERLFREALAKNPSHKIQGLACYDLARFLERRASSARLFKLNDPGELDQFRASIMAAGWGHDYPDRLRDLDPDSLEREAAAVYERVTREFADFAVEHEDDKSLPQRPKNLGAAAGIHLDELLRLGIGKPAPEILGVDLEGKPMKLSDYRGKVVALYFCSMDLLGGAAGGPEHPITVGIREAARRFEGRPFAVLGVATDGADRGAFRAALESSGLPARFWWDAGQAGKPGPIQTAWNARFDLYMLDRHGVIRYKHVLRKELFEKAAAALFKELLMERKGERK